jgi:NADH oxidase (H2O2-forming)
MKLLVDRAEKIEGNRVVCSNCDVEFDKAIIATGGIATAIGNSMTLRTIEDADKIKELFKTEKPTVIGAGILGCELVDVMGGILLEAELNILPNFDPEFAEKIELCLSEKAEIKTGVMASSDEGFTISAVGVSPNIDLAKNSGIKTSEFGIGVNDFLQTSMENVYAAGDCIEEKCFFTGKPMHSYLGPQSERQGVIAGNNAAGGEIKYMGSLNSTVSKICGYELGITGLCAHEAKKKGLNTTVGRIKTKTKPEYSKEAKDLIIKMVFEGEKLVGCQALGGEMVQGIINLASYAMQHNATVDDLINLSYCFSPPVCSAPNTIILCAEKNGEEKYLNIDVEVKRI